MLCIKLIFGWNGAKFQKFYEVVKRYQLLSESTNIWFIRYQRQVSGSLLIIPFCYRRIVLVIFWSKNLFDNDFFSYMYHIRASTLLCCVRYYIPDAKHLNIYRIVYCIFSTFFFNLKHNSIYELKISVSNIFKMFLEVVLLRTFRTRKQLLTYLF